MHALATLIMALWMQGDQPVTLMKGDSWDPKIDACAGTQTRILVPLRVGSFSQGVFGPDTVEDKMMPIPVARATAGVTPQRVSWFQRPNQAGYVVLISHGEFGAEVSAVDDAGRTLSKLTELSASFLAGLPGSAGAGRLVVLGMNRDNSTAAVVSVSEDGHLTPENTYQIAGWPRAVVSHSRGAWIVTSVGVTALDEMGQALTAHKFKHEIWGPVRVMVGPDETAVTVGSAYRLIGLQMKESTVIGETWWHPRECVRLTQACRCTP